MQDAVWLPQWTTPVKIESGGRYALGLNHFHNSLEDLLIKSVTWLADSLPTFTFSCWAIGDIARREQPDNWDDFVTAFQRRESALAIGRYLWQPNDRIPGSNRVSEVVRHDPPEYDTSFSVMKSARLGAYGLYYAGSAYNLGLVEYNENGVLRLTATGERLHGILDRRYQKARAEYYHRYRGQARVPKDVLVEWGRMNDPAAIREPGNRDERDFYKNLLFRLDQPGSGDLRRETLAFFLECIDRCAATGVAFSEDVLRNINYYSAHSARSGSVQSFEVPAPFRDVHFYWNLYEGHVYFREWLSRYFQVFLDHLKYQPYGSTVEEFFAALDGELFDATLSRLLGRTELWLDGRMGALVDAVGRAPHLSDLYSEERIGVSVTKETPASAMIALFVLMMVDLWHHFRPLRPDPRYLRIMTGASHELWFDVLYRFPNLMEMPVRQFLRQMLKAYVIEQHDRIMIEKRDLRRCWFTVENGRYFFVADESQIDRPAKYSTIMAYLRDMGLIAEPEAGVRLTSEGQELFARLKREFLR